MSEPLYLDYSPAIETVKKMQNYTGEITTKIGDVTKSMENLHNYWKGDAYQKRSDEFVNEFKPAMDNMTKSAEQFNEMLNKCMAELKDLDERLRG